MKLQLSAPSEKIVQYKYFGEGRVVDLMPKLTKAGYVPAGVAVLVDRRQNAPKEVRANFSNSYFGTGDSAGTDEKGGALLTLDSVLLRQLTLESPLVNGALKLEQKQWKELRADKEHSLYLTPAEVAAAHGKGYVLNDGKFVPANKAVAKAWDHLNRGKDLQNYTQLVSEASNNSDDVMRLHFDQSKPSTPTLRSLVLSRVDLDSFVLGYYYLSYDSGRLVGVAPEAQIVRARINPKHF
ncbi:MAG: hypothetical protein Q7S55_03455 [Nanoarchaeota archaeon]|nr:hypothetical protein [Nanoarchaeota archaeon]